MQLSLSEIHTRVVREDYKLLDIIYNGNQLYKIRYKCPNNHVNEVTWKNWIQGRRCRYCANNDRIGKRINRRPRLTIEEISLRLSNEKYILLDALYNKNRLTHVKYKCPEGHVNTVTWGNWTQGRRCGLCRLKNYAKEKALGIKFIRDALLEDGYELLSNEYVNSKTKFKYKCSDGHIHEMIWTNWKKGQRCPTCKSIKMCGSNHPNWKGGISNEPYCDVWTDREYKQSVKDRDNNICQNPDCWRKSIKLILHHIDYVKKNCRPDNLITLCISCNGRANKNRSYHTNFYQKLLTKRLGYNYE